MLSFWKNRNHSAFTVGELIVVVTILAILATIGFLAYQWYIKDAQNTKRTSDLSSMTHAVVQKRTSHEIPMEILSLDTSASVAGNKMIIGNMDSSVWDDYGAGIPNYALLGLKEEDFKDPETNGHYILGWTKRKWWQFELAWSLAGDSPRAIIRGTYIPRAADVFNFDFTAEEKVIRVNFQTWSTLFVGDYLIVDGSYLQIASISLDKTNISLSETPSTNTADSWIKEPSSLIKGTNGKIISMDNGGVPYALNDYATIGSNTSGCLELDDPEDFIFDNSTQTITGYNGSETNIIIPCKIGGIAVLSIGYGAFSWLGITNITIPDGVVSIEDEAFQWNSLVGITLPDSIMSIGVRSFGNNQLATVNLGDGLVSIGDYAFQNNNTIASINIPNSLTTIGESAFTNNLLTSLIIPDSVTTIGASAFQNNKISNLTLSKNITIIESGAFANNLLTSLIIPDSVTTIWPGAFGSNKLVSVNFGSALSTIDNYAFAFNFLVNITIPWNVKNIEHNAFRNNVLTNLVLSDGVLRVANGVFRENKITNLYISNTMNYLGPGAFQFNHLTTITLPTSLVTMEANVFNYNGPGNDTYNITGWTSWGGGTWNLSWVNWIKQ